MRYLEEWVAEEILALGAACACAADDSAKATNAKELRRDA
jgi:hypothetical protein